MRILILIPFLLVNTWLFAGSFEDLMDACKKGDFERARAAIAAGADVKQLENGYSPLIYAVLNPEITQLLLDNGADPNAGKATPLEGAVLFCSIDVVKLLLSKGANPNKSSYSAPLLIAVGSTNCLEIIKLLVDAGADINVKEQVEGGNLLYVIGSSGYDKNIRRENYRKSIPIYQSYGYTFPAWAQDIDDSRNNDPAEIIQYLVSKGVNINEPNTMGYTGLCRALYYKKIGIAKAMVMAGADVVNPSKVTLAGHPVEYYPIIQVAEVGDAELMRMVITKGANVNIGVKTISLPTYTASYGGENYTPLIVALCYNQIDVAKVLIENGADVTLGANGYGNIKVAEIPDMDCLYKINNKTPIFWAIETGNLSIISLIAEKLQYTYNADYTYKIIGGSGMKGNVKYKCIPDKKKVKPSEYAASMYKKDSEIVKFLQEKKM